MHVILLSGKAEAGKTLSARMISSYLTELGFKAVMIPYGDYVKHTAKLIFGWNGEKDEAGRNLLQWWGTDVVRAYNPYFWSETVVRLVDVLQNQVDYVIVDEARFPDEISIWNRYPFTVTTVRVERPGHENKLTPEQRAHISETALDSWPFDCLVKATTKFELECCLRSVLFHDLIVGK